MTSHETLIAAIMARTDAHRAFLLAHEADAACQCDMSSIPALQAKIATSRTLSEATEAALRSFQAVVAAANAVIAERFGYEIASKMGDLDNVEPDVIAARAARLALLPEPWTAS